MAWKVDMVLKLLTIVLMVEMLAASPVSSGTLAAKQANGGRRLLTGSFGDRRLLQAVSGEPLLPPDDPLTECVGIGPVCPGGGLVECAAGGIVGCMCAFIRACEPDVSSCYYKNGKTSIYCGF